MSPLFLVLLECLGDPHFTLSEEVLERMIPTNLAYGYISHFSGGWFNEQEILLPARTFAHSLRYNRELSYLRSQPQTVSCSLRIMMAYQNGVEASILGSYARFNIRAYENAFSRRPTHSQIARTLRVLSLPHPSQPLFSKMPYVSLHR